MQINVFGGGLYGVLLASKLSEYKKLNSSNIPLILFERNQKLLTGWSSKFINNVEINNGFHGIEMPRSKSSVEILFSIVNKNIFQTIPNFRLLSISENLIPYDYDLSQCPNIFRNELNKLFANKKFMNKEYIDKFFSRDFLDTKFGHIIKTCSSRYSDELKDSIHLFFPWFFPKEFSFLGDDEGSIFQYKVRNRDIIPTYLVPKTHVFNSLSSVIEKALLEKDVNINKNKNIDKNLIESIIYDSNQINIWAASSFELLNVCDKSLSSKLLTNKRFMNICLFTSESKEFENWINKFERTPSEILFLSLKIPGLARVSFPINQNRKLNDLKNKRLLMVEYYAKTKEIKEYEIDLIREVLQDSMKIRVDFYGKSFGRIVFQSKPKYLEKANKFIDELVEDAHLKVPFRYWGPVNMAKSGINAISTSKLISKYF